MRLAATASHIKHILQEGWTNAVGSHSDCECKLQLSDNLYMLQHDKYGIINIPETIFGAEIPAEVKIWFILPVAHCITSHILSQTIKAVQFYNDSSRLQYFWTLP
jgi:hypothetical protein